MYHENAGTNVAVAIQYIYILDAQKYRGNLREEEYND